MFFPSKTTQRLALVLMSLSSSSALAIDGGPHEAKPTGGYPGIGVHIDAVQHFDEVYDATDPAEEITEAYAHAHMDLGIFIDDQWSIVGTMNLDGHPEGESGHVHGAGGAAPADRWWEEQELDIEKLALRWRGRDSQVQAGKFKPRVGLDMHALPGLYGYQVLESYEIPGRVGLAGAHEFRTLSSGHHRFDLSLFRADRSQLSRKWLDKEDRTTLAAGGPSNTDGFQSYALSYNGDEFGGFGLDDSWLDGLSYRLGYAMQKKGQGNADNERRWSIGLEKTFQLHGANARLVAERMDIKHFGGEGDHDRVYLSAGLELKSGPWQFGGSLTNINNDAAANPEDLPNQIVQMSVGYAFTENLMLSLGMKDMEVEDERRQRVGLGLKWHTHF